MKKAIYILIALVLVGGLVFYFISFRNTEEENIGIQPGDELNWSAHFPEIVPEYTDGTITEMTIVDPELSRFEEEVAVTVEDTSREGFNTYVDNLISDGWMLTYQSPETETFYNVQLSLDSRRISTSLDESGVLRLSTYVVQE